MKYKNILVTGGAGFVGSNIACMLKNTYSNIRVTAYDNLHRNGSALTLPRLKEHGVVFVKADVRDREKLLSMKTDCIIECSAEPSVMAGVGESPEYLIDTNLGGAVNCFELARITGAAVLFLSTSRIYPVGALSRIQLNESETRYKPKKKQVVAGISEKGISEEFPLIGTRTMYGSTKLAAELLLQEYVENYGIHAVVGRFGLIAGPWQFGKVDQGVVALWVARHIFGKPLSYIGFEGKGKQVRDVLHIDDASDAVCILLGGMARLSGQTFNIGGGAGASVSLRELTDICRRRTGKRVPITRKKATRPGDVAWYITDYTRFQKSTGWKPLRSVEQTVADTAAWITAHSDKLYDVIS